MRRLFWHERHSKPPEIREDEMVSSKTIRKGARMSLGRRHIYGQEGNRSDEQT